MNLERSIGQLFAVAARATFANESSQQMRELFRHVRSNHVGGVIWFQSEVFTAAWLTERLQQASASRLLVSADLEAGSGMRFTGATFWPPAMAVAAAGDPELAFEQGRITAREALAIGVNQILAPVVDVNVDPANPVINVRSYGSDPEEVARYATAFIEAVQQEGAIATAKHFPGHGDTHVDSHRSLPALTVGAERLDSVELLPFRAAIEANVASIMVGHLAVPLIEPEPAPVRERFENVYGTTPHEVPRNSTLPATVSPRLVDGLLRATLGFDRLVVTDAFDMGGLSAHFEPGEAAVRAIEAGIDQVLYSTDTDAAIAAVLRAVRTGRISAARLDESVERIAVARRQVRNHPHSFEEIARIVDAEEHRAVAEEIARRSIVLLRDDGGLLPLDARHATAVVVTSGPEENPLTDAIVELGCNRVVILNGSEADRTVEDSIATEHVILLLALRPRSGAGAIQVPRAAVRIAERFGGRACAISFGSPYIARELSAVGTFVCAWGIQPVLQKAAIDACRGAIPFRGSLPVTVT